MGETPKAEDDYDEDGLDNLEEYENNTNPGSADTDGDGLNDYEEVKTYNTNPTLYDTDGDGMGDGTEIINSLNPLEKDTDGNGIIDSEEVLEQKLIESKYSDFNKEECIVKPEITVKGTGDYSKHIEVKDASINSIFKEVHSMVGTPIDIELNKEMEFESSEITFKLENEVLKQHNINNLKIAYYNTDINEIEILETSQNKEELTVSTTVNHFSHYFVIDEEEYYYDIDIKNSESVIESGKADVVFVVDTTGSMDDNIYNVKENISEIVDRLNKNRVDIRFGLVEYSDIINYGIYTTKDHGWFTDVEDFKTELALINTGIGWDETPLDGLEVARRKNYRSSVNKYIILLTDEGYNLGTADNPHMTLQNEVELLKGDNINVSVVTETYLDTTYQPLYIQTGGIWANIQDNFAEAIMPLAEKMMVESNEGAWIRLSNGSIVQLDKDPSLGDMSVDTDDDGVPDLIELGTQKKKTYFDFESYTEKTYYVWDFISNPTVQDTDGDLIDDDKDLNPNEFDVVITFIDEYGM